MGCRRPHSCWDRTRPCASTTACRMWTRSWWRRTAGFSTPRDWRRPRRRHRRPISRVVMTAPALSLKPCDIAKCEAMCCHDGVYLSAIEERRLRQIVDGTPELRRRLPAEYVIDGWWNGRLLGRKTATRPHAYRNPDWPAHFPRTRCVFADEAGLCELQKLGLQRKHHPWRYKPFTCWMFPLDEADGKPLPPSPEPTQDPYRAP